MTEYAAITERGHRAAAYLLPEQATIGRDPAHAAGPPASAMPQLDSAALAETLEELDSGVLILSEHGRVALANDAARRELRRARPLALDDSGHVELRGVSSATAQRWREALRDAVRAERRHLLRLQDAEHHVMASVVPLATPSGAWALVLLGRRQPAPALAVEMLARLYRLTAAECQVLGALLLGERVQEVAHSRGVRVSTLRTQVHALRAKMGASRIEDLFRMVAELPPMSSALRSPPLPHARGRAQLRSGTDFARKPASMAGVGAPLFGKP